MRHFEVLDVLAALLEENSWASHDNYPVEDWQYEVMNNDTRLGYRDWLYNKLSNEE